jgi:CRISPR/Cas system-associated protein endoribonuclease Cas2
MFSETPKNKTPVKKPGFVISLGHRMVAFCILARIVQGCTGAVKHMDVRERPRQD